MLARELRHLRERASLTGDDIKDRLGWSASKISRIENARISVSKRDIELLLDVYGANNSQRKRLLMLAEQTQTLQAWRIYPTLPEEFLSYLEIESAAALVRQWEVGVIPGIVLGALNDAPVQHESKKLATVRTILPRTSAPPKWPVSSQTMAGNDR